MPAPTCWGAHRGPDPGAISSSARRRRQASTTIRSDEGWAAARGYWGGDATARSFRWISASAPSRPRRANWSSILRDMTHHRQQEEALRASEERFALAMHGSSDGIWTGMCLPDRSTIAAFQGIAGLPRRRVSRHLRQLRVPLHPEDHAPTMASSGRAPGTRVPYHVEYRLHTNSGEYRWFGSGQAIWDAAGQATRMAGSITDITDQKRLQHALNWRSKPRRSRC